MKKGFIFTFDAIMAVSVVLFTILFLSVSLNQVHFEKNFFHIKASASVSADNNFYLGLEPSDSLNGTTGFCSSYLKYPENLILPLTKITSCVMTYE